MKNIINNLKSLKSISKLTNNDKVDILKYKKLIINFLEDIEKDVCSELEKGRIIKDAKIVNRLGNRQWSKKGIKFIEETLKDKAYIKKLITVTEAKSLLGNTDIENNIFRKESKVLKIENN